VHYNGLASSGSGQPSIVSAFELTSESKSSVGAPVVPSIITSRSDAFPVDSGFLSARSIGFNETYTPVKLLGKGSFGKAS